MDTFGAKINSNGKIDNVKSKVILKIMWMDTKRNTSEVFKTECATKGDAASTRATQNGLHPGHQLAGAKRLD